MAKQFISDADMAKMEQSQPQTQKQFISDDEMAKLDSQDQPQEHGFGYRVAKSASGALPYLGGAFGGLVGTAAGIPGQIGGAALGYGMGKTAQNALLAAMGDEDAPKTREEIWSRAAKSIPEGATLEAGGLVANKVIGDVAAKGAGLLQRTLVKPKANYGEILAAGDKLGVKPTPGMLSDSPVYQKLENSLQQSPTFGGWLTKKEVEPTYKGIQQTGEDLANVGSGDRFQAGQAIQGKLSDKMAKQAEISSKNFEELNQALPNIEAPKKSVIGTADLITKHPVLKYDALGGIRGKAQNIADTLKTLTTANDINKLKTYVGKLNPGDANEAQFLKDTYRSLDNLVQTSIRRESQGLGVATGDPQAEKDAVGLLKSRLSANKKYKSTMEGLEQTGSALGANISRRDTPGIIARKVSDLRPEDVARRMVNPNDQETVNYFSSKHPEMFNIAAKADIASAGQRATHKDGLSVPQFLNRFKNVPDNVQKKMFGADYERMQAMKTLSNASPNMVGPSGTQQAQEVAGLLNPITQAKRLGQYGIYKGAPELESTLSGVSKIANGENLPGVGGKQSYLPGQIQGHIPAAMAKDASKNAKDVYKDEIASIRSNPNDPRHDSFKYYTDDQAATMLSIQNGLMAGTEGPVGGKGLLPENVASMESMFERRGLVKPSLENQQAQNALDNLAKAKDPKDIEGLGFLAKQKMEEASPGAEILKVREDAFKNPDRLRADIMEGNPSSQLHKKPIDTDTRDFHEAKITKAIANGMDEKEALKLYLSNWEPGTTIYNHFENRLKNLELKPKDSGLLSSEPKQKTNVLRLSNADDKPIQQPLSNTHESAMENIKNRYGDNPPKALLKAEELSKKGHDEPYAFGDIGNIVWRGKNRDDMHWNSPMPFPTKTGDLKGVLGKGVPDGSGPDPFMWMDDKYKSTKRALDANYDKPLEIHTRSDLIAKPDYMEKINPEKHKIYVHMASTNESLNRNLEPGTASFLRRMSAVKKLAENGFDVTIVHDDMLHNFQKEADLSSGKEGVQSFNENKDSIKNNFDINPMQLRKDYQLKNVKFDKNPVFLTKDQVKKMEETTGIRFQDSYKKPKK